MSTEGSKQIIIVDDDTDLLDLLDQAFIAKGYKTRTFIKGGEALKTLSDEVVMSKTALLVLDRLLPDMDGLDLLRNLNKMHPKHMPVLILSTLSAEKDVLAGLEGGAIDYITKPFNLPILMKKAEALIKG